jgi:pentatricopeptide repeat protein
VGRGEIIRAKQLINAMEHREIWYGFKLPAPVSMTYTGVVWVLLKNGRLDEAMAMFRKYQNFLTENGMKLPEDVMSAVTTALANSENN